MTVELEREDAWLVVDVSARMAAPLRKGKVDKEKQSSTSHVIQRRFNCEVETARGDQLLGPQVRTRS